LERLSFSDLEEDCIFEVGGVGTMSETVLNDPRKACTPTASDPPIAPVVDQSDILDWETNIEAPPPRKSGTIRVTLKSVGRSRPIPIPERSMDE
jgi:hypothetical protein